MTIFTHCLAGAGGFAICWFSKDFLHQAFVGSRQFVLDLEAKARAVKAGLSVKAS